MSSLIDLQTGRRRIPKGPSTSNNRIQTISSTQPRWQPSFTHNDRRYEREELQALNEASRKRSEEEAAKRKAEAAERKRKREEEKKAAIASDILSKFRKRKADPCWDLQKKLHVSEITVCLNCTKYGAVVNGVRRRPTGRAVKTRNVNCYIDDMHKGRSGKFTNDKLRYRLATLCAGCGQKKSSYLHNDRSGGNIVDAEEEKEAAI